MHRIVWASLVIVGVLHTPILRKSPPPPWEEMSHTSTGVRFEFTDGALEDVAGRVMLRQAAAGGGELFLVPNGDGWAVEFPPVCEWMPEHCPRAILESDPVDWLNPDTRPVRWGASVRLGPHEVSDGANVVQKGLSVVGTQFKLQVDGEAAHPSCVMAGTIDGDHRIFVALATRGIADGAWHNLGCERDSGVLRLLIDGAAVSETMVPTALSIVNDLPLRVGGKGRGLHNDQFHGTLDNVFVEIG